MNGKTGKKNKVMNGRRVMKRRVTKSEIPIDGSDSGKKIGMRDWK